MPHSSACPGERLSVRLVLIRGLECLLWSCCKSCGPSHDGCVRLKRRHLQILDVFVCFDGFPYMLSQDLLTTPGRWREHNVGQTAATQACSFPAGSLFYSGSSRCLLPSSPPFSHNQAGGRKSNQLRPYLKKIGAGPEKWGHFPKPRKENCRTALWLNLTEAEERKKIIIKDWTV